MKRVVDVMTEAALLAAAFCLLAVSACAEGNNDKSVDRATDRGLRYLARKQCDDGSWRGTTWKNNSGIAALAVMAFLAKGHTPGEGKYGEVINKGIDYVVSTADPRTGYIVAKGDHCWGPMYGHGISTLLLAEVVGMTSGEREKRVREALGKAVILILRAQKVRRTIAEQQGGWRYHPQSRDSDISVAGWQLLSLRAAKNAGADVPISAINDAVAYVKRSAAKGGGFRYLSRPGTTRVRAGIGILSLEICGRHHEPEAVAAAEWLLKHPPKWPDRDFYYGVYYCSQAMFQMGDKYWNFYRPRMETLLLSLQNADGTWLTAGKCAEQYAGTCYCTAMAVLALSVKYHYLPIYQR